MPIMKRILGMTVRFVTYLPLSKPKNLLKGMQNCDVLGLEKPIEILVL